MSALLWIVSRGLHPFSTGTPSSCYSLAPLLVCFWDRAAKHRTHLVNNTKLSFLTVFFQPTPLNFLENYHPVCQCFCLIPSNKRLPWLNEELIATGEGEGDLSGACDSVWGKAWCLPREAPEGLPSVVKSEAYSGKTFWRQEREGEAETVGLIAADKSEVWKESFLLPF